MLFAVKLINDDYHFPFRIILHVIEISQVDHLEVVLIQFNSVLM